MNLILLEIIRQKRTVLTLVLVLIILNIVFMYLITAFQEPAIASARSKWSDLRNQAARSGYADAATLYRQGLVDLDKLNARIPAKREFARVLSDLLETASDNGVATDAISYKASTVKDEALLSYQLSLAVSGNYAAVKSFLSDLRQNPELVIIEGLSLTNKDLFVEHVVMNLNLTLYLREGA
ncbi:MAG: type 4a pilus biogenesis protein PilO [Deltaproteobacteria bacterium]|nr:type 4a pilus biogenesis protein PilO [Deltaproteobacteria bacterium]